MSAPLCYNKSAEGRGHFYLPTNSRYLWNARAPQQGNRQTIDDGFLFGDIMSGIRVETCSVCGKDFWSGPRDGGVCFSCSFKMEREKQEREERERFRLAKARVVIAQAEPVKERPKKWTRASHPKPEPTPVTKSREERRRQAEIYEQNKKFGYVYLMRAGNGQHKIGISKHVGSRLAGLRRQFPIQIEVVHHFACHDRRKVERLLHEKYAGKRAELEWFNLDADDIQWILSLKDYELE